MKTKSPWVGLSEQLRRKSCVACPNGKGAEDGTGREDVGKGTTGVPETCPRGRSGLRRSG